VKKRVEVVGAVLVNERDEILCALRSKRMAMAGMWEFPGGKIEAGETPQESLRREIREELSVEIEVGEFVEDTVYEYESVEVRLMTYYGHIVSGEPRALEHEKLEWVPRGELMRLAWAPADVPAVEKVVRDRKQPVYK
jgi:8-oxo-dGTP diphosphatase